MLNKFRNNDKGFTLVELMMVIVILGVLAGVAIPMVGRMRTNALKAKLGSYADSVGTALILEKMAEPSFVIDSEKISEDVLDLVSFQGDDIAIIGTEPEDDDDVKKNSLLILPDPPEKTTAEDQTGFTIQAYAAGSDDPLFVEAKKFQFAN